MSKIILHIDLNAFFIRCEEIKDPSLVGKAVIVGGEGRNGIVSTSSYKAREYGVKSGMPTFQAKMLCKNLIICHGDYEYYELMSREFINYIKKYSHKVEQMSIDECFVDITEEYKKYGHNDIIKYLTNIQNGLFNATKLKCSIGVAPTKFLAKMASDMKKPMGITIVRKRDIEEKIFPLPVGDYFGIGKKTAPRLYEIGVETIGDLYREVKNNNQAVLNIVGSFADGIIDQLEGNSNDELTLEHEDRKSIGVSRTFARDTNNKKEIKDRLISLASIVIDDMKSQRFLTKTITIQYKDADHDTNFKSKLYSKSFDEYIDDKDKILSATAKLFDSTYDGTVIRLIGFSCKNLRTRHGIVKQLTFDNYEEEEEKNKTELIINELNRKSNKKLFMRLSDLEVKDGNK